MPLLVDIEKRMGRFCLSSRFEAGDETLALLGASGSGKSMTLKCIAGVETPDCGRIVLNGRTLFDSERKINLPARLRKAGYLFQNYALFPNMTVAQNIACGIHGKRRDTKRLVEEKIAAFYLQGLEAQHPRELSGGQQQRVALARILAGEPELLMLDEPLSALDSFLKWQLEQEILRVRERFSGAVLFVSHNRDEVFRICDRVVVMEDGKTQATLTKHALFSDPQTLSAALISGCQNTSRAKKTGEHTLLALDWQVSLKCEKPVPDDIRHVGFRAHCFEIADRPDGGNTLACSIERVVEDTFSFIVMARLRGARQQADRPFLRWDAGKEQWNGLKNQKTLLLRMPEDRLILLR